MPFGEMDCVRELDYLAQEIRACCEALDDARDLVSSRARPPEIVGRRNLACGLGVFDERNLGCGLCLPSDFASFGFLFPGSFHRQDQTPCESVTADYFVTPAVIVTFR